ncbi:MAG: osmotically inducible protein OsmC [Chloroflexi bacterium HGW-Chloroflexi-8]|jgi:putative redox protein|nr:MAG: osmotically inducible protein OsmC [Chloroflexi bacterium HGW-Chloroflexi-8]
MDAKVSWHNGLIFTGSADSGFQIPLGGKKEPGETKDGFLPMELFAIGLAGCTGMDVISILEKMRQDVTSFEVKVHADRVNQHPKVFSEIIVEYILSGHNIDIKAVEKAVQLSEERYCPAQAMLSKTANIRHVITLV